MLGLDSQPSPRRLGLTMCQAQDNVGLAYMSNLRRLDLATNQVQDNDHSPLACAGE